MMNQERGYGRKVLEILESHGISYEHSPTSIDTLSVILTDEELNGKEADVVADIRRIVQPDRIEVQRDMAMLAVVGQGMVHRVGIFALAAQVFGAFVAGAGVNIRMINQGSSELNIIVGVEAYSHRAVRGKICPPLALKAINPAIYVDQSSVSVCDGKEKISFRFVCLVSHLNRFGKK